jgi:hypothetical protein
MRRRLVRAGRAASPPGYLCHEQRHSVRSRASCIAANLIGHWQLRVKSAVSSAHPPCPLLLPSLPNRCIAAAHGETGEVEEVDEKSKIGRRHGKSSRGRPGYHAAIRPWSQRAQIFRHIAELLQYNRVRKLANVRIVCTLECDRPRIGRIA